MTPEAGPPVSRSAQGSAPESPLAPQLVAVYLAPREGGSWRLAGGGVTGSTNDDARGLARLGDPGGVAVLATVQTAGRGRFDRVWESPDGGVYLSVLVRPRIDPARAGAVPLVAGVSVVRALQSLDAGLLGVLRLKWPNDVLADGRKLAGILVESSVSAGVLEWLVIGVGLNVIRPGEGSDPSRAYVSDLVAAGSPALEQARVAAALLDLLRDHLEVVTRDPDDVGHLSDDYRELSGDVGRSVAVRDRTGAVVAEGVVTGFAADGALLLDTAEGPASVAAGEVTLRS